MTDAPAPVDIPALLRALIAASNASEATAAALLHDRVVLHRLDGTVLTGRADVLDAVVTRDTSARLSVLDGERAPLQVALELREVPGRFVFELDATVHEGVLIEIWMRA